jgi:hypothetical protein
MYINIGLSTVMRANPTATQGEQVLQVVPIIGVGITRPQQFLYQLQASGLVQIFTQQVQVHKLH